MTSGLCAALLSSFTAVSKCTRPPSPSRPQAVTLPLSVSDGKWHHVCVTWSTRDGQWEAYQDGVLRGSGMNLSPWHPIKPGGVFILGQEQVKDSSTELSPRFQEIAFFTNTDRGWLSSRTPSGVASTPPSRLWARCRTCTCGRTC